MKRTKHFLLLFAATALTVVVNAQTINGDLNHSGKLEVSDVTHLISNYLTGTSETISGGGDPFFVDNSRIVGTWYKSETETITFNADGTTDYGDGYTYKFLPNRGVILFYNMGGIPFSLLKVYDVASDYFVVSPEGGNDVAVYSKAFVSLSRTEMALTPGNSAQLTATVTPSGTVTWTSSNEQVATVSSTGLVMAVGEGVACITAESVGGKAVCTVTVADKVFITKITLSESSLTIYEGDSYTLHATVEPTNASNQTLRWRTSNPNVLIPTATGVITAKNIGTATITCSAADGSGVEASCKVTVVKNPKVTYTVNGVSFKMIAVQGGTFKMGAQKTSSGSPNFDADAFGEEGPVHNVILSDYSIGETEVTQALWVAVMGSNPSNWLGDNLPVETVTWNDCQTFISKLNQLTGKTFRLPTEAEWEYAARGGNKSQGYKYSGSNTIDDVAWYYSNSSRKTHEVGMKKPNELGLYDMSGNVCEWCQDWYDDYTSSAQTNPKGPSSGYLRVIRGGGWFFDASLCRVSCRHYWDPTSSEDDGGLVAYPFPGFRLAQ